VDLSLRLGGQVAGGVSFDATVSKALPILFPPSGGMLSPYIIGTWDAREGRATTLQLVNPTGQYIYLWVAFFNDNEKPLENDVRRVVEGGYGVAKAVAFSNGEFTKPMAGVIGYQRQFVKDGSFSEAPLHTIPVEIGKRSQQEHWGRHPLCHREGVPVRGGPAAGLGSHQHLREVHPHVLVAV
jgi:hypothetical protein